MEGSQMTGINLRVATLKNAKLKNCNLRGATLAGTDLEVSYQKGLQIKLFIMTQLAVVCTGTFYGQKGKQCISEKIDLQIFNILYISGASRYFTKMAFYC